MGFDIERRPYPGQLVLQDVTTLDGAQFKDATVIVASPPCQEYSYMAMPWRRGKQIARALRGEDEFPEGYEGSRTVADLSRLFLACFRIKREASEAAGRDIPLVIENVNGAQPWVGKAQARYGSYYLWGDVDSIGGRIVARKPLEFGMAALDAPRIGGKRNPDGTAHPQGSWFAVSDSQARGIRKYQAPCGPRLWKDRDVPRLSDGESLLKEGVKAPGLNWSDQTKRGQDFTRVGGKQYGGGCGWDGSPLRQGNSRSTARKQASALIAKVPFRLARHIARVYKPETGTT